MSNYAKELIVGLLMVGGITGVIVCQAVWLARRETREALEAQPRIEPAQVSKMRRAG